MHAQPLMLGLGASAPVRRFAVYHRPVGTPRGLMVQAHAFGEEMNKSRRMCARMARALATEGFAVLQLDLLGCGDSAGEFADAAWTDWIDDLAGAATWLSDQHAGARLPLWWWGHRVGALLATAAAQAAGRPANFLFWHAATQGRSILQQLLRLKAAADLAGGRAKAVIDEARKAIEAGQPIRVAGYELSAGLCKGLESAALDPPTVSEAGRAIWLEVSPVDDATLSPAVSAAARRWAEAGWRTDAAVVNGPAFWQTTEVEDAPRLVEATLAAMVRAPLSDSTTSPPALADAVPEEAR